VITIDTTYSSTLPDAASRPPEIAPVYIGKDEPLKLRVFLDRSVIEVFANGKQCVAVRLYPGREDSLGVSLRAQGRDAVLTSLDAWQMKPKLAGAAYCAEKGLLDRMFYNSITVWEEDLETEIREIAEIGLKHVLLVAFDMADQMPSGRITGTQKLLDAIEKAGAQFESIFVDTSVMNGPATAFCSIANRMIKEKWGFPTASAPSNGSYMWKKARELWGFKGWSAADAGLESLASFMYHDMIFSGPMAGATRIFPAVAMADAFTASAVFAETKRLPELETHPLNKLFPDFVGQLKGM